MTIDGASVSGKLSDVPAWVWVAMVCVPVVAVTLLALLQRHRSPPVLADPKNAVPAGPMTYVGPVVFGGIFFLAGAATLFFITLRPVYRSYQAERWPTTNATITSSELVESRGPKGRTHRLGIRYRFTVDGRSYAGDQYDVRGHLFSDGRAAKQEVVNAHPPGRTVPVHYNPADPADNVLTTALPDGTFSFIWFPILFMVIGVGSAVLMRMSFRPSRVAKPRAVPLAPTTADARRGRRRIVIGLAVAALFWNGIVGVIWFASGTWWTIPFALVGVGIIVFFIRVVLRWLNPVVGVTFAAMPLRPGELTNVTFTVGGNYTAIKHMVFELEGREQVTFRQGTDTRTETHVAWRLPLYETTSAADLERGRFTIDLPAGAMPSFAALNNQFVWKLCCRGEIPHRPDIKDEFDVTVVNAVDRADAIERNA